MKIWKYYEIRNGITKILGNNRVGEANSLKKKKKKRLKKKRQIAVWIKLSELMTLYGPLSPKAATVSRRSKPNWLEKSQNKERSNILKKRRRREKQ